MCLIVGLGSGLCFDPAQIIGVDVSSGVVLFVWCSVLVEGYSCFELVVRICVCVISYILYYTYYILYYYILYYYVLYSSHLLFYSFPSFFPLLTFPSSHPINTCRYLHILIYILSSFSKSDPARSIGVDG